MAEEEKIKKARKKSFLSKPSSWIGIIIVIVAIAASFSCFYSVDETEQAVVTRLGKYLKTTGPGLQFKMPFGIDKNYNVPVRVVQTEQFGFTTIKAGRSNEYRNNITDESSMLTGDLNIINVEWIVQKLNKKLQ